MARKFTKCRWRRSRVARPERMKNLQITISIFVLISFISACQQRSESPAQSSEDQAVSGLAPEERSRPVDGSGLDGTQWRLVKIMSMDDRTFEPADTTAYTLNFGADGNAAIQADCNRAHAAWSSSTPGQLEFGPIASTRALCPEESLSETYLRQFEWVRSYVLEDGRLYLATMADGAIIELEPAD